MRIDMPTVLKYKSYRFYFFSHENNEPVHIHVDREKYSAKFWIEPVRLARNLGFSANELNKLFKIVIDNKELFREYWYDFFKQ
jgi:hypothetical protein